MLWAGGRDAGREGERIKGGWGAHQHEDLQSKPGRELSEPPKIQGRDRKFAYLDICLPATASGR